ncbi:MAG: RecQ family ATP-dependent DNA helicase [Saprospiraceae bacterium]|nr:RecQ family ATP-dependent DNA helicase [Saprospiraceae bacterium]
MQEDIINSVLNGNDTLALLPTGGGKSICFQVPAMSMEGICIVVSPLIALMKDQVDNLRRKGIKALAVYSGMHRNEIDIALDNCAYGDYKFLYVSPERLTTELMRERLKKMNVNLIAVDEAHCVSQWGYDFRPPYLKIAEIREILPDVPLLALTATATPDVVVDIQDKLGFKKENVFRKSFERNNLTYVVFKEEDKFRRLLNIANKIPGTGVVYVRNRRKTREISDFLNKNSIRANYYHAGLDPKTRENRQNEWMLGSTRIMVSTNAFGMGIDKPNVRFVVHLDLPDNLESYFQEAGRGGRDEKRAYAVLLFDNSDVLNAEKNIKLAYPEIELIKSVYKALGSYFQLAIGSGKEVSYDFDIAEFSDSFKLNPVEVFHSLKFLEREGYIMLTDSIYTLSKIHFDMDREDLYKFQLKNVAFDKFIKVILRSYSGIFDDFIKINETDIARRTSTSREVVEKYLMRLDNINVLTYVPQKNAPQIIFTQERLDVRDLTISKKNYSDRKDAAVKRLKSVIKYATSANKCRSQILLAYFGETDTKRCGKCDVCVERNKIELSELEFNSILEIIKPVLKNKTLTMYEIVSMVGNVNEDKILKMIQWLLDNDKVTYENNVIRWKNK